jgi:hypothetical protein
MTHKEGNFGVKEKMQIASTMSALTHKKGNFRGETLALTQMR